MKSFKLLVFGNSYSNDALTYLSEIFLSAGYDEIIVGNICDGGCNINNHWQNIDDTLECFHPAHADAVALDGTAGCSISINRSGKVVNGANIRERYENTVSSYDWDAVTIQHGPKDVEKIDTYSHLPDLIEFIKANLRSDKTKFLYHMIWKYNDNLPNEGQRTAFRYGTILDITKSFVLRHGEFEDRVIPAATMRQNLISSYLTDGDISRDYGHMGLTLGRYALGLLWYCYLTGGSVSDVKYVPEPEDANEELRKTYAESYNHTHLKITETDLALIREAVENALASPFAITESVYTKS